MRSAPDVSLDAGSQVFIYYSDPALGNGGGFTSVGGTDLAAPMMAGMLALADQGRALQGDGTLDGPSQTLPALYKLPSSDFNAMTSVSNIAKTSISSTGLGSPQGNLLIPALAAYGTADQLVIPNLPASVTAGVPFQLTVQAEDAFGAIDPSASGSVVVNGSAIGTMSAGVATVTLTLTAASQGANVQVSADGLKTTTFVKVVAATESQLVISTEPPATASVGTAFTVVVTALDVYGNIATSYSGTITVALSNNPNNATLSGTLTQPFVSGVATFADLSLNEDGVGYTLAFSGGGTTLLTTSINVYSTLTIVGNNHDNVTVAFADAQDFTVTKNGVKTTYNLAKYDRLVYQGPAFSYSKLIFNDPADVYTATQTFTSTQLVGANFAFEADNVSNLYVYAGSGSTANVTVASGTSANFYVDAANSGYSYIANPATGVFSQLIGFSAETVTGSAGSTYAYVYSTTKAAIVADPSGSSITVGGAKTTLANFPQLYIAGASDGTDQVNLLPDSAVNAEFVGTPSFSYITGSYKNASFLFGALYSANVSTQPSVFATDTAFFESFANNVFNASPTLSTLSGSTTNATGGSYNFSVQAANYLAVSVLESGSGTDSVNLTSTGNAVFVGTSTADTLTVGMTTITVNTYVSTTSGGSTVLVPAASRVTVNGAGNGTDSAFLYDSPGANALVAAGKSVILTTNKSTLTVNNFAAITAEQQNGSSDTLHQGALDFVLAITGNWTRV
jgi:hypothetical protein